MNKELESFERIKNYQIVVNAEKDEVKTISELLPSSCNEVETALKNYEELNKDYSIVVNEKIALGVMYVKEHKIVGIIKNKGIDILKLKECAKCKTPDEYNKRTGYFYHKDLDQEEFDLAKEILL